MPQHFAIQAQGVRSNPAYDRRAWYCHLQLVVWDSANGALKAPCIHRYAGTLGINVPGSDL